ncbi:MAG: hypothetical protein KJ626_10825 [Verrucomicrobia bacterium]|nr:hypothetical protein [Verrucomicrobiota bacterium]
MVRIRVTTGAAAVFFLCSLLHASAGSAFTAWITDYRNPGVRHTVPIVVEGARLRADTTQMTGGKSRTELIYAGDKGLIWHIDHSTKTYIQIDEAAASSLGENVTTARDFFEGQMVKVGLMDKPTREAELEIEKTPEQREVNGLQCVKFLGVRGKAIVQEIWVAPWSSVAGGKEFFTIPRRLLVTYDRIIPSLAGNPLFSNVDYIPMSVAAKVNGYPVLLVHYVNGRPAYKIQLGLPTARSVSVDSFKLPAGYERKMF